MELVDAYPPAILEPAETAVHSLMEALADRLKKAGVPQVQAQVCKGHPIAEVLAFLKYGQFSLVVMGAQGRSLLSEILLGSVAYNIARLAPCPVLLIPRAR
jgi:nucleotide-binding universal stress UspA family protein